MRLSYIYAQRQSIHVTPQYYTEKSDWACTFPISTDGKNRTSSIYDSQKGGKTVESGDRIISSLISSVSAQRQSLYVALQHSAPLCTTLQHTATHCNTGKNARACALPIYMHNVSLCLSHCNTLQYTAIHCNALHHTEIRASLRVSYICALYMFLYMCITSVINGCYTATHCNTFQHTATHCTTLQ